jgi:hypothetical protein
MNTDLKQCSKCKEVFPRTLEYFPPRKEATDGLRGICRVCRRKQHSDWRSDNEEYKEKRKRYRKDNAAYYNQKSKEWREKNPERHKQKLKDWRANNLERSRELNRESNTRHKDKINAHKKRRYHENRDREIARGRDYYQRNKLKVTIRIREYRQENPQQTREIARVSSQRRRARIKALPNTLTSQQWGFALEYFGNACAICGAKSGLWTAIAIDHWIPLTDKRPDNPGTVASNVIPLCHNKHGSVGLTPSCNQSKYNKDPIEWVLTTYGRRKGKEILRRITDYFDIVK